ncbi:MAG: hypothetical protein WCW64_09740 [Phycisphaerae bacterium]|jgi:hypothetical protein
MPDSKKIYRKSQEKTKKSLLCLFTFVYILDVMQITSLKWRNNIRQAFIVRELNLSVAAVSKALRCPLKVHQNANLKVMEIVQTVGCLVNKQFFNNLLKPRKIMPDRKGGGQHSVSRE